MFKIAVCDDEPVYLDRIINSIKKILNNRIIFNIFTVHIHFDESF